MYETHGQYYSELVAPTSYLQMLGNVRDLHTTLYLVQLLDLHMRYGELNPFLSIITSFRKATFN